MAVLHTRRDHVSTVILGMFSFLLVVFSWCIEDPLWGIVATSVFLSTLSIWIVRTLQPHRFLSLDTREEYMYADIICAYVLALILYTIPLRLMFAFLEIETIQHTPWFLCTLLVGTASPLWLHYKRQPI